MRKLKNESNEKVYNNNYDRVRETFFLIAMFVALCSYTLKV